MVRGRGRVEIQTKWEGMSGEARTTELKPIARVEGVRELRWTIEKARCLKYRMNCFDVNV